MVVRWERAKLSEREYGKAMNQLVFMRQVSCAGGGGRGEGMERRGIVADWGLGGQLAWGLLGEHFPSSTNHSTHHSMRFRESLSISPRDASTKSHTVIATVTTSRSSACRELKTVGREKNYFNEKTSIAPLTFSIAPATFRWHL